MNNPTKPGWKDNLMAKMNELAEELSLDDFSSGKMRDVMMQIAREQYKRGGKGGAAWAFEQARAGKM
jgi:hypothetical protein